MAKNYWIVLTDLANERNNTIRGWRWTNGTIADSSDLICTPSFYRKSKGQNDCIAQTFESGMLFDVPCRSALPDILQDMHPMCQTRSQLPTSLQRNKNYEAAPIPVGLPAKDYADGGGCSRLVTSVKSVIKYGAICSSEAGDWCVGFYFNAVRRECRIVHYTDANIFVAKAEGWVKLKGNSI